MNGDRALEPRAADELDRLVDRGVARHAVRGRRAGTRRAAAPRAPAGRACARAGVPSVSIAWSSVRTRCTVPYASCRASARSRVVEPARPRLRSARSAYALVLEDAADDVVRRRARAGATHRRPRSEAVVRPSAGRPRAAPRPARAAAVLDPRAPDGHRPAVAARRARRCAARARGRGAASSSAGRARSSSRSAAVDLLGVRDAVLGCGRERRLARRAPRRAARPRARPPARRPRPRRPRARSGTPAAPRSGRRRAPSRSRGS